MHMQKEGKQHVSEVQLHSHNHNHQEENKQSAVKTEEAAGAGRKC